MTVDVSADEKGPRISLPTRDELSPTQQVNHDAGPHERSNLALLMALAPSLGGSVRDMGFAMRDIALPPDEREIVALASLNLERGEYELAQHRDVVKMMGIPQEKAEAVARERYADPIFTARERALLAFTRQVVKTVRVDDPTFANVSAFYDRRQIVETVLVIGYYMMLARLSEVAELPIDGSFGTSFWKGDEKSDSPDPT